MIGRRARFFADRRHRPTDGEAHDVFKGDQPAVDDRQAGGDATGFDEGGRPQTEDGRALISAVYRAHRACRSLSSM
jgi:hypothetical protein